MIYNSQYNILTDESSHGQAFTNEEVENSVKEFSHGLKLILYRTKNGSRLYSNNINLIDILIFNYLQASKVFL